METSEKAVFSLGNYQKGLSFSSRHQRGTGDLLQAILQELPPPDAPARANLSCKHWVIVSELQRHLCVNEREETGWLASVFNDVSAAGKSWKLQVKCSHV